MTTPGGVPNLPVGALTEDNLASQVQDMTPAAMRARAAARMPAVFGQSGGGNPLQDLTPFGFLIKLFGGFNSNVANADPANIQGPDDLPDLLVDFLKNLPIVGQFVDLLQAITGNYTGHDPVLQDIEDIFAFLRNLFGGHVDFTALPTPQQVWQDVVNGFIGPLNAFAKLVGGFIPGFQIPGLDASKITSGSFPMQIINGLTQVFGGLDLTANNPVIEYVDAITHYFFDIHQQTTQNSFTGLVQTVVSALSGTGATFADVLTALQNIPGPNIGTPVLGGIIPGLDASKIISGVVDAIRIPLLDAGKIISGIFSGAQIPGLDASKIISGALDAVRIPLLDAAKIVSGIFGGAQIPGLDASKIISGAIDAVRIPLLDASKIVSGIFGGGQIPGLDASKIISGAIDAIRIPLLDAGKIISGIFNAGRIPALDASKITSGTLTPAIAGIDKVIDNFVQGAGGSGIGNPVTAMLDWASNLLGVGNAAADAAAAAQAATAALQAQLTGNANGGQNIIVKFGDYDPGAIPSIFTKLASSTGAGGYVIANSKAVWGDSGGSAAVQLWQYNVAELATDYFDVAAVMPNAVEGASLNGRAYTYLIARCNAAGDTMLLARFSDATIAIGWMVNGVTSWGPDQNLTVPAGATIRFRCTGLRNFQALINGSVRCKRDDTDSKSVVGATNRKIGFGGYAESRGDGTQTTPGSLSILTGADNSPAAVVGTGSRVYRGTTTATGSKAAGAAVLPANTMDTVDFCSTDLTWDPTQQMWTVTKPSLYLFSARISTASPIGANMNAFPLVYKNGVLVAQMDGHTGITTQSDAVANNVSSFGGGASLLSLKAGDTVQIGFLNSLARTIVGNAGGTATWASLVKVG